MSPFIPNKLAFRAKVFDLIRFSTHTWARVTTTPATAYTSTMSIGLDRYWPHSNPLLAQRKRFQSLLISYPEHTERGAKFPWPETFELCNLNSWGAPDSD